MKLPVGSRERVEYQLALEHEIVLLAHAWELARGEAVVDTGMQEAVLKLHRRAEKLARAIRKWRRLG